MLLSLVAIVLALGAVMAVLLRYYRYRFISFVRNEATPDMEPHNPEGYTDKQFYYAGETITFFLRSDSAENTLSVRKMAGPFEYREVRAVSVSRAPQAISSTASEQGCAWKPTLTMSIDDDFSVGYYQALLTDKSSGKTFEIYFIIGTREPASIVILAPVSTWTAYNTWGGKSLYQNKFQDKTVYFVSTERPNTAFETNHSIHVEANIFHWFSSNYPSVSVIPDYLLEEAGHLDRCKLLVLAYHCEYISKLMHWAIRSRIVRGASLISLGANQLYWIVKWNGNHTRMECRKDLTFFEHTRFYGGMWKHHFRPQERYLGGRYNGSGMHTYAPYRLTAKHDHWILQGLGAREGDLFGLAGIDGKPICGAETDKTTRRSTKNVEIIASGMNCETESIGIIYNQDDPRWDGSGGGEMSLMYLSNGNAVLNAAAIHSGAGLGVDPIFTGIIQNFVKRYGPAFESPGALEPPND